MTRQHNGQRLEDTKGVIRSRKSKIDRQYNGQKLEDTKGVIRSHLSKKERPTIQRPKEYGYTVMTNNDLQNITAKTTDRAILLLLK
jgi:hypothetical protein